MLRRCCKWRIGNGEWGMGNGEWGMGIAERPASRAPDASARLVVLPPRGLVAAYVGIAARIGAACKKRAASPARAWVQLLTSTQGYGKSRCAIAWQFVTHAALRVQLFDTRVACSADRPATPCASCPLRMNSTATQWAWPCVR
ncbi:hypothetical protein DB823_08685 [Xanthomonas perforans]|nr:hypothetical protein DB823_08685 [Xanthomonas perforans]